MYFLQTLRVSYWQIMSEIENSGLIDFRSLLEQAPVAPWMKRVLFHLEHPVKTFFGVSHFNHCFREVVANDKEPNQFARVISAFQLDYEARFLKESELPSSGAFIVVSNHPHGLWDGVVLGDLLIKARSITKTVATFLTDYLTGFKPFFISVDPRSNKKLCKMNRVALLSMCDQLSSGEPLLIFPAGQVSRFNLSTLSMKEPPWSNLPIELATRFNIPIVPVFISGANSWLYQLTSLFSLKIANGLLVREFNRMAGRKKEVIIGRPITPDELARFEDASEKITYLKNRTYGLSCSP